VFHTPTFYRYSEKSLGYEPVRYFRTKLMLAVAALGLLLFGLEVGANYLIGDPLGFAGRDALASENGILKSQLRLLSEQAALVQKSINTLVERNNQLRLMVDLGKIDQDVKQAAVGGSLATAEFSFLSREARSLLGASTDLLSRLEREVDLQKRSYEEINKKLEHNKVMFAHLPAIKPSQGSYSINGFGMRIHPVLGIWRMHEGVDILNDVGTPVYASGDATVRFAGRSGGGYGNVIELDHGYGYTTLYAHLSAVLVREGRTVKRGELIGRVGRSGLVSGPHLHYEVRLNGRRQNPVDFFFDDVDAARYRTLLASTK
jgi:murein DD-endopeptidase MepM/ murein hydrolase activator NlpD